MGSDSETERSTKEKKKLNSLMPIAKPLAGKKLCKRTFKLVRRGTRLYFKSLFFPRWISVGIFDVFFLYMVLLSCWIEVLEERSEGSCQEHSSRQQGVSIFFSIYLHSLINFLVSFLWHLNFTLMVLDNFTTIILVYHCNFFFLNIGSH
jgi:hypothetical protein